MSQCVLLTRPDGSNESLAAKLNEKGFETLVQPVLQIESLASVQTEPVMNLDRYDFVIFISINAVHCGLPKLLEFWPQWPVSLRWLAVGKGTSDALAIYDILSDFPDQAGSEGLLALPVLSEVTDKKVLIVRGLGGRETLKTVLTRRGGMVDYLEVYERVPVPGYQQTLANCDSVVSIAVATSVQSLVELVNALGVQEVAKLGLVVPSARIRDAANEFGLQNVYIAGSADDEALLSTILRVR